MKIDIVKKTENKLLDRTEIEVHVEHHGEAVPKREDFLNRVSALLNKERGQVVLIKLEAKYGMGISTALVHAYESAERAQAVERDYLLKRSGIGKEEKQA
jgi:ribosomal protein S24E